MSTVVELNLFAMLMFLAVGGLVWFLIAREISSTRRMTCMMRELGLDYDLAKTSSANAETIISLARARCLRCRSEGLCERWLVSAEKGEAHFEKMGVVRAEDFCPNAATFKRLATESALQVEPHDAGEAGKGGPLNVH